MDNFPDDENGQVLRRMAESGDDLSRERDVDFSILFENEDEANLFCKKISEKLGNFSLKGPRSYEGEWDVTATTMMIPSYQNINRMEKKLLTISLPFGGRLDGWGCFEIPS